MADSKRCINHLKGPPTCTNVFGFKEDKVEWREASYGNRDAAKVSTHGAHSSFGLHPCALRGSARHVFLVYRECDHHSYKGIQQLKELQN